MEKVMTSMHGTLRLQLRMREKMTCVAPLSTRRSQHSGDRRVAVSAERDTHTKTHLLVVVVDVDVERVTVQMMMRAGKCPTKVF